MSLVRTIHRTLAIDSFIPGKLKDTLEILFFECFLALEGLEDCKRGSLLLLRVHNLLWVNSIIKISPARWMGFWGFGETI